jgi:large subunit ribosomal protein L21
VDEGASCTLEPLLYVDGEQMLDSSQDGSAVRVEARVVAHERGPKLRVVKFKPKRGYKRRTGHRQELTRIEITSIEAGERPRQAQDKRGASGASGPSSGQRRGTRPRKQGARGQTAKKETSDGS